MVSVRDSGLSCPGSSPGQGLRVVCVVFLGKKLYSHSSSLHTSVQMGTSELNAQGNPVMDEHPIQGGIEIFLVASCHRHQNKLWPDEPAGSYADFAFISEEEGIHLNCTKTCKMLERLGTSSFHLKFLSFLPAGNLSSDLCSYSSKSGRTDDAQCCLKSAMHLFFRVTVAVT